MRCLAQICKPSSIERKSTSTVLSIDHRMRSWQDLSKNLPLIVWKLILGRHLWSPIWKMHHSNKKAKQINQMRAVQRYDRLTVRTSKKCWMKTNFQSLQFSLDVAKDAVSLSQSCQSFKECSPRKLATKKFRLSKWTSTTRFTFSSMLKRLPAF